MEKLINNTRFAFIFFWIITMLLYAYGYRHGFYEDFIGFLQIHNEYTFSEYVFLPKKSLYWGVNAFHYIFISLFGTNALLWFLLFTALHALNGVLAIRFFRSFSGLIQRERSTDLPVFLGALLFIVSPLVAEVVVWKACSHYMTSVAMMLLILNWLLAYLRNPAAKYLWFIYSTFFVSIFFLEYFYLTPVFSFLIISALFFSGHISLPAAKAAAIKILLPLIGLFLLYFVFLHIFLNTTVARVGDNGMFMLSPPFVADRLSKYTARIYFFDYFFPYPLRQKFYAFTSSKIPVLITGIALFTLTLLGIIRYKKLSSKWQLTFALFIMAYCSCVVILPMWFQDMFSFQGSRYYYLPALFFYVLFTFFFFHILPFRIAKVLVGLYFLANIAGTAYISRNIGISSRISERLMNNFKWKNADTVLLLNLPALYNGVSTIQADSPSNFNLHLELLKNSKATGKVYDVSSHNMVAPGDGVHVTVEDSTHLKIILNQYGTWLWYKGFGAYDYENELYKVQVKDNGFTYQLTFRHKPSEKTVILFQTGGLWKQVDMNNLGKEQW